jgi:hypothetical protein
MILLQWGDLRVPVDCGPSDDRSDSQSSVRPYEWEQETRYWIGVSRQVFAPEEDDEIEFDGVAISMDIMLFFDVLPEVTEELSGNIWLNDPSTKIDFMSVLSAEGVDMSSFGKLYKIAISVANVG